MEGGESSGSEKGLVREDVEKKPEEQQEEEPSSTESEEDDEGGGEGEQEEVKIDRPWVTRFRSKLPRRRRHKRIRFRRWRGPKSWCWEPTKKFLMWCLYKIPIVNRYLPDISGKKRVINVDTSQSVATNNKGTRYKGNAISTTKYGPITFIPLNLYEQFKRFANFWFLIVACIQFIPQISPLNPVSSVVPLVIVLLFTAIKEAIEDIKRRLSDRRLNNTKTKAWKDGKFEDISWKKVKVGHILRLRADEDMPADVVVLTTSNEDGVCYVETANLDGESNLKVRQALAETVDVLKSEEDLNNWKVTIECEAPDPELYTFHATLDLGNGTVPLSLDQTLWRGCTLRNTEWVYAVVVYTGMETKIMKNARQTPYKRSTVEKDMNTAIISVFLFMMFLDFLGGIGGGVWANLAGYDQTYLELSNIESSAATWGIQTFAAYLILENNMIPLSLYVYMEMLKIVMAWRIRSDVEMYHPESNTPARTNTSNLAEELGQIEYIFSDKTGTLTSNTMFFRQCSIKGKIYGKVTEPSLTASTSAIELEDASQDTTILEDQELLAALEESEDTDVFFKILALCHTVIISSHHKLELSDEESDANGEQKNGEGEKKKGKEKMKERNTDKSSTEEGYSTDVEANDEGEEGKLVYQAASPDEAALVTAARQLGYVFSGRTNNSISITVRGVEETWELLNVLEFNSDRKRMSVIVRDPRDGKIKLLCKGADQVILQLLAGGQEDLKDQTFSDLSRFASVGLRTLCLAIKVIDEADYKDWNDEYEEACLLLDGREKAVDDAAEKIEKDLELVGATAIEDKLQDGVPEAIATLLEAGIKMWVLTGDKMETAINIGFSCMLLDSSMHRLIFASEKVDHDRGLNITDQDTAIIQLERYIAHYFPKMSPWKTKQYTIDSDMKEQCTDLSKMEEEDRVLKKKEGKKTDNYALIIDGKALRQYLKTKKEGGFDSLASRFLELAMQCKVVICCRVAPGQKALVVEWVQKGIKARTLAIGDGANDVPMIQTAHVGVGISGKEGRQAVNTADYAIAQFRYLVPLLLVHGHWSYRRLCVLVLYSFYKNMAFAITLFYYGFFCGFSAQSLYESWAISLYNVTFTGLPILMTAIFDKQNSREQLLGYPQLYERGRLSMDFSWFKYWVWLFTGMYEATIIYFFGMLACQYDNWASNGLVLGMAEMGSLIFTSLIYAVNLHNCILTRTWTIWNHLALYFSILIWFPFIIVLALIPPNGYIQPDNIGWKALNMMSTAAFWFTPILTAVAAVLPTFVWRFAQRNDMPANYQIIQEIGRIQRKKKQKSLPMRLMHTIAKKPSGQEHTGYAFAQEAGGFDLLLSLGMAPLPKSLKRKINKSREEKEKQRQKEEGSIELEENEDPPKEGGSSSSNSE